MDERHFDRFTLALTGEGSTRRRVVGGLAALLGIAGIGGLDALDAEAKKKKNKKNKKKIKRLRRRLRRERRRRTQNNSNNGVTIIEGDTTLLPAGGDLTSLNVGDILGSLGLDTVAELTDLLEGEGLGGILDLNALGLLGIGDNADLVCIPTSRTILALCATGSCDEANNTCSDCPDARTCGDEDNLAGLVCCVEGFICGDLGCVVDSLG